MSTSRIICVDDKQALVTKDFKKKASIFGTAEFNRWREYKAIYPEAEMITKTIKKNPNKRTCTKNMTYKNMVSYINTQDNRDELLEEFRTEYMRSKVQKNPYRYLVAWFRTKFDDYDSYMSYFEEISSKNDAAIFNKAI